MALAEGVGDKKTALRRFLFLFEGFDARCKEVLRAEVGVVLLAVVLVAFAVSHFAEDTAAGAGDAFHRVE